MKDIADFESEIAALRDSHKRLEVELLETTERLAQALKMGEERASEVAREYRAVFMGESVAARALRETVENQSRLDGTLLLTGPRGAGESAVAQSIHYGSSRRGRPFVFIDCTRFNADQEMMLFDSADAEQADSKADLAHKGTLYMEQVDHLPLSAQWTLREYMESADKIRAKGEIPNPDFRLIVYARRDLSDLAAQGKFDHELARLLGRSRMTVPALAERREDILDMANALLRTNARSYGKVVKGIDQAAGERLLAYDWPGNIDELDAVIKQSVIVTINTTIEATDVQMLGGRRLGDYNLLKKLGEGGMGEVWFASHAVLDRPAAVKLIRTDVTGQKDVDESELLVRFEREAKVTAMLRSPHTVQLYDFGTSPDGGLFYVMEFLDGRDLEFIVENFGPMRPERVVHFLTQTAYSLAEAHDAGLIHRDIKPSNIFSCRLGPYRDYTKLIDFGIVRRFSDNATRITKAHIFPGTPAFAAPEMVTAPDTMGPLADIYSLGCTAFYLLTGKTPFQGDSDWAVMMHHANTEAPKPSDIRTAIPNWCDDLVLNMMEKNTSDRPSSALALIEQIRSLPIETPWRDKDAADWWEKVR